MKFEHFGINVPDARAMADWYVTHCGMQVAASVDAAPFMHFLADSTGRVVVEIYTNPLAPVPDYRNQDPLVYHFAFAVDDPEGQRDVLVAAGATVLTEARLEDGSFLIMLRDPWGIPLQLCKRGVPFES